MTGHYGALSPVAAGEGIPAGVALGEPEGRHVRFTPDGLLACVGDDVHAALAWDEVESVEIDVPASRLAGGIKAWVLPAVGAALGADEPTQDPFTVTVHTRDARTHTLALTEHRGGYRPGAAEFSRRIIGHFVDVPASRPLLAMPAEVLARLGGGKPTP